MTTIAPPVLQLALEASPFAQLLGLTITQFDSTEGILTMELPHADHLARVAEGPQLHGGPIACLIDTAATFVVMGMTGAAASTVDLRIDYLRPANGSLRAVARPRRLGRTLCTADVDVFDADVLAAVGRATFSVRSTQHTTLEASA